MRNWFFFFNEEQELKVNQLRTDNYENFKTWFIFTAFLPLLPFIIAVLIHVLIDGMTNWGKTINNGSIPIISFGIVSSGIIFLMEKLKKDDYIIEHIKRRVMAIAVVLLFLTASLFIFENLIDKLFVSEDQCLFINSLQHGAMFIASLVCLWFSIRIGQNMFFLQKQIIDKDNYSSNMFSETNEIHGKNW